MNKLLLMTQPLQSSLDLSYENANSWHQLRRSLIDRRVELGLSQKDLADRMGITQPAISQFESFNANPRIMTLLAYAYALDVSLDFSAGPVSK